MIENYKHNDIILVNGILHRITIISKYNPHLNGKSNVAYLSKLKEKEKKKIKFVEQNKSEEVKEDV